MYLGITLGASSYFPMAYICIHSIISHQLVFIDTHKYFLVPVRIYHLSICISVLNLMLLPQNHDTAPQEKDGEREGRGGPMRAIRTMKMLHALNKSAGYSGADIEGKEIILDAAPPLAKGPFELDRCLSIFKSDSRFVVKRLDHQGQQAEVSR